MIARGEIMVARWLGKRIAIECAGGLVLKKRRRKVYLPIAHATVIPEKIILAYLGPEGPARDAARIHIGTVNADVVELRWVTWDQDDVWIANLRRGGEPVRVVLRRLDEKLTGQVREFMELRWLGRGTERLEHMGIFFTEWRGRMAKANRLLDSFWLDIALGFSAGPWTEQLNTSKGSEFAPALALRVLKAYLRNTDYFWTPLNERVGHLE